MIADIIHPDQPYEIVQLFHLAVVSWSDLGVDELIIIRDRLRKDVQLEFGITKEQEGEIYRLAYKILKRDAPWIRNFIYHQTNSRKPVQDLDTAQASKVISGMRAIAG